MYAAHAPHILTFKIRTVAPSVNTHRKLVFTGVYEVGDVKLRIIVGSLRISGKLTIHPYSAAAIHSVEMDENILVLPILGDIKRTAIETGGVMIHNAMLLISCHGARGFVDEWIARIIICREIISGLHLPIHRHADIIPLRIIKRRILKFTFPGTILCSRHPFEFPGSVQVDSHGILRSEPSGIESWISHKARLGGIGDKRGMSCLFIYSQHMLVGYPAFIKFADSFRS